MDPILALIGDLYGQIVSLQQRDTQLVEALARVTEERDRLAEATKVGGVT